MSTRLAQFSLAFAAALLPVALCDAYLRRIDYRYTPLRIQAIDQWSEWRYFHAFQDRHFVYDPDLIWRPRGGVPPFNSHSYRYKEISVARPLGSFRIFAIGDSNTLGWLGNGDFNWPDRLEEVLSRGNPNVSVINAGAYGYSSFQGVRRLRQALPFRPDLVLISFGLNDAMRVTISDAEFAARRIRTLQLDRALMKLRTGQLLLSATDKLFSRERRGLIPRVSIEEYRQNLREMIRICRENDVKIVLLTRPFTGDSPNEWWWKNFGPQYNAAVVETGGQAGVPVIDVYGHFRDKPQHFIDESHFTEEGFRVMAKLLSEGIRPLLN